MAGRIYSHCTQELAPLEYQIWSMEFFIDQRHMERHFRKVSITL